MPNRLSEARKLGLPVLRISLAIPQRFRKAVCLCLWEKPREKEGQEKRANEKKVLFRPPRALMLGVIAEGLGTGVGCACRDDGEVAFNGWPKYPCGRLLFPCPAAFLPQIPDAFFCYYLFFLPPTWRPGCTTSALPVTWVGGETEEPSWTQMHTNKHTLKHGQ